MDTLDSEKKRPSGRLFPQLSGWNPPNAGPRAVRASRALCRAAASRFTSAASSTRARAPSLADQSVGLSPRANWRTRPIVQPRISAALRQEISVLFGSFSTATIPPYYRHRYASQTVRPPKQSKIRAPGLKPARAHAPAHPAAVGSTAGWRGLSGEGSGQVLYSEQPNTTLLEAVFQSFSAWRPSSCEVVP